MKQITLALAGLTFRIEVARVRPEPKRAVPSPRDDEDLRKALRKKLSPYLLKDIGVGGGLTPSMPPFVFRKA